MTPVAGRAWLARGALTLLLVYTGAVHHGLGPVRRGAALHWYSPRELFRELAWLDPLTDDLSAGLPGFGLPALALAALVLAFSRSALARWLAVTCVLFTGLCAYYGLEAAGVWRFFHWRASAVMALTSLVVGAALTAPWLARRWESLPWNARLALYAPTALAVVAFMRNATGTDPSLQFSLSPWPVVPFFGLELIVPVVCVALSCLALARTGFATERSDRAAATLAGLWLAGLVLATWLGSGVVLDWQLPALALCVSVAVYASGVLARQQQGAPGRHVALGAMLVALPVVVGLAWVERDYTLTRDHRAGLVNDALGRYLKRTGEYPDTLEELVDADLLERVPEPQVGFRMLGGQRTFVYQNFGISYLLEFSAPRWVQCAYNPPYEDEDEEEAAPGAWSCPSRPPELW